MNPFPFPAGRPALDASPSTRPVGDDSRRRLPDYWVGTAAAAAVLWLALFV